MALKLKLILKQIGVSQTDLAKNIIVNGYPMGRSLLNLLINRSQWPASIDSVQLKAAILQFLQNNHVSQSELKHVFEETEVADANLGKITTRPANETQKEVHLMLLRKQTLNKESRRHFKILPDPFTDEMQNEQDVYLSEDARYVRAVMRQTAKHGGMLAVVGESGSGKSTLRHDLIEWINTNHEPITVIEPYVIGLEDNNMRGKTLKSVDIVSSIIHTIDSQTPISVSSEARARQMHALLKESTKTGRKHVLIIEEAHCLPIATLKHLKRFYELQEGFKKLLSIILIGQTELQLKLSEYNPAVREVVQRTEIVNLLPLSRISDIEGYLEHKFARIDVNYNDIFESSAFEAISTLLQTSVTQGRGEHRKVKTYSLCYPLAINNLVTGALNLAWHIGATKITGEIITESIRRREDNV